MAATSGLCCSFPTSCFPTAGASTGWFRGSGGLLQLSLSRPGPTYSILVGLPLLLKSAAGVGFKLVGTVPVSDIACMIGDTLK